MPIDKHMPIDKQLPVGMLLQQQSAQRYVDAQYDNRCHTVVMLS